MTARIENPTIFPDMFYVFVLRPSQLSEKFSWANSLQHHWRAVVYEFLENFSQNKSLVIDQALRNS